MIESAVKNADVFAEVSFLPGEYRLDFSSIQIRFNTAFIKTNLDKN